MKRVDQDVVCLVLRTRPDRKVGQIREIAYAPGSFGPYAVELGCQAPCAVRTEPIGNGECGRSDDDRGSRVVSTFEIQPVIAQRQAARQFEGGLAYEPAVEVVRRSEVVE